MHNISYTQLHNIACPIRHYFSINEATRKYTSYAAILGDVVHSIYQDAFIAGSFSHVTTKHVHALLAKHNVPFNKIPTLAKTVQSHIHTYFLKLIKKNAVVEQRRVVYTTSLPFLDEEVAIHLKPDLCTIDNGVVNVIELKSNKESKYNIMQLRYYAWAMYLKDSSLDTFILRVFWTATGKQKVVDVLSREQLLDAIERYMYSANKAYKLLQVESIAALTPKVTQLIKSKTNILTELFTIIHPEHCGSCKFQIICPAYLQEITRTFLHRMRNLPISDKNAFYSSYKNEISTRHILAKV